MSRLTPKQLVEQAQAIVDAGYATVELCDRREFAFALFFQGYSAGQACHKAFVELEDTDGALQMLARHRLAASLTTPPARSYADGVADVVNLCSQWSEPGAKMLSSMSGLTDAEHAIAQRTAEGIAEAASGLLSQGEKA